MHRYAFALALALVLACAEPAQEVTPDPTSRRAPPAGPVIGRAGLHGGHAWLGIPYAAPPEGPLRWRAPRPAEAWTETREALRFGARCPQFASALESAEDVGALIGREDCLTLNVYAPRFEEDAVPAGDARLPVMVWIHGGGNTIGASSFYDGSALASSRDLVVVTINYRLGPLGWFRHASLRADGTEEDRSGNFGTLDIVRSLEWVRDNITAFGGDPGNVTVFGESAGGRNTFTMLVSPKSEGLFHRAIVQSGGTGRASPAEAENFVDDPVPGLRFSSGEVLLKRLQQRDDVADRQAAKARLAAMREDEVAALLRGTSVEALFAAYADDPREPGLGMIDVPRLFLEPTVLPEGEYEAFAAGHYHRVPIITGTNRDEDKLFLYRDARLVRRILGFIPRLRDPERYELLAEYASRAWKANAVDEVAPLLVAAQGASVYAYRFDWDEQPTLLGADLSRLLGAAHALEIPFVFGHFDLGRAGNVIFSEENEPGRLALSDAMMSYWAQFAYEGDPGRGRDGTLPAWTAWDASGAEAPKYVVLDTPADRGVRMASETESAAALLAELSADTRFEDGADRCAMLVSLAERYDVIAAAVREGSAAARLACGPEGPEVHAAGG